MPAAAPPDPDRRTAFARLLETHRGIVLKVAGSYCRDPDDRADLAQEIAAQAWRAFPLYDPARRFSTWLYRIALNVAISELRGRRRIPAGPVPIDTLAEALADPRASDPEREQQVRALHRFIAQLPALDRALMLLYLDDHGYRDIADVLGISETNVATKLGRLKARIRAEL